MVSIKDVAEVPAYQPLQYRVYYPMVYMCVLKCASE